MSTFYSLCSYFIIGYIEREYFNLSLQNLVRSSSKNIELTERLFPVSEQVPLRGKGVQRRVVSNEVQREKFHAPASRRITAADHGTKKSISHCGSKKLFVLKAFPCATKLFLLDRRSTSFEQRNDI